MIPNMQELRIAAADAGQRLDRFLRKLLPEVPLAAIFKHLRSGGIRVDGQKRKPDLRLVDGMVLQLRLPESDLARLAQRRAQVAEAVAAAPARAAAWRGPRPHVVHRDGDVWIVDKPAGMAVQPGTGQGDEHLVAWAERELAGARTAWFAPAPAHRIDRGTSGLCAIGVSPAGLRGLAAAFRDGLVHKVYLAVVHSVPSAPRGTIDRPLRPLRNPRADGPKMECAADGKVARTDYERITAAGDRALLRIVIEHGRMHQIRAHLASIGHPIVGDRRYGSPVRLGNGFLLHAHELRLRHPISGGELHVVAPAPAAMQL